MLAPMFKDMRVAIVVEPVGTLVRTNATHVQGQRVTLFDVAFGELFADPEGSRRWRSSATTRRSPDPHSAEGHEGHQDQRGREARDRVQIEP